MMVEDALNRMDLIMNVQPLPESKEVKVPSDASIDIENISFSIKILQLKQLTI